MSDLQSQINQRIEAFVADIAELARRQALETLAAALGGQAAARGRRGAAVAPVLAARGRARAKGEKRPPAEIAAMVERLHDAVAADVGLRIEELARKLSLATRELTLPMRKLIADGRVRTEGERRATRYFPGDGTPRPRRRKSKK